MTADVADSEITAAWKLLAEEERLIVEPASAARIAALQKQISLGNIDPGGKAIVAVLTRDGLKDPEAALRYAPKAIQIPATIEAFISYLHD